MENWFGGLVGAAGSLFGGLLNTSSAQAINAANLQQQMYLANNSVSMRVADAKRAGINPLAALGVSSPGFVGATNTDPGAGVAAAGQDISRALMATQDKETKLDAAKEKLINLQIAQMENDVVHGQLVNSTAARQLASVGSAPGVPLPMADPRYEPEVKPAMQRFTSTGGLIVTPSRSVTESQFSALPGLSATPALVGDIGEQNAPVGGTNVTLPPYLLRALTDYSSIYGATP